MTLHLPLVAALALSLSPAVAELPEAEGLLEELSAAHAKLPGYVAKWHAKGEEKSLDLTIAEERASGRFALHLQATSPEGKIELRQWSPDGKEVFIDSGGTRGRVNSAGVELEFMRGFGEIFLDRKAFDAAGLVRVPVVLLDASMIHAGLYTGFAGKPGWSLVAGELEIAEVNGMQVVFTSDGFGTLAIERATGVLLRQEVTAEDGKEKRILERVHYEAGGAGGEIARITRDWTTLGATDIGLDPSSMLSRQKFLQVVIESVENGQASLEKLEEKLARKDELLDYGRRALAKSAAPKQGPVDWEKAVASARQVALESWKATVPGADPEDAVALADFLKEPANRTPVRNALADAMVERDDFAPMFLPLVFGPMTGRGLRAETATGRVAKAAIEKAFCRAYIAAMLEEKMAATWGERDKLD